MPDVHGIGGMTVHDRGYGARATATAPPAPTCAQATLRAEHDDEVVDAQLYREMRRCLREIGELCTPRPDRPGGNYMIVGSLITGIIRSHGLDDYPH